MKGPCHLLAGTGAVPRALVDAGFSAEGGCGSPQAVSVCSLVSFVSHSPNECKREPSLAATWTPSETGSVAPRDQPPKLPDGLQRGLAGGPRVTQSSRGRPEEKATPCSLSWPQRRTSSGAGPCSVLLVSSARGLSFQQERWKTSEMSARTSPPVWPPDPEPWGKGCGAGTVDNSLTSLQWLQEFSILTADPEKPSTTSGHQRLLPGSCTPASAPQGAVAPIAGKPISSAPPCLRLLPLAIDYRTNRQVKPPYSYATLIYMALRASRETRLTLAAIYTWIRENFCYYRYADPSWQNSIRHSLSLNKCFQKVPRQKDEPGKGGFWQVNPEYADLLAEGVCRRRRLFVPSAGAQPGMPSPAQTPPRQDLPPWLPGGRRRLGKRKQPAGSSGAGSSPPSSPALCPSLAGDLGWTSALDDDPFSSPAQSDLEEDLELTAALGSLAQGEEASLAGQTPGRLSPEGPPSSLGTTTLAHAEELTLYATGGPWGEGALAPLWAFEEGACFAESFLAEIQHWGV